MISGEIIPPQIPCFAVLKFQKTVIGASLVALSTADFKNGLTLEYEGKVFQILEFQHVKPGKGGAFVRSKLRNLQTGATVEKTWRAGDSMEAALVERRNVEFLYRDGDDLNFMDMQDFEPMQMPAKVVGDVAKFLKDNTTVQLMTWKDIVLSVELPQSMEYVITQTDPGFRGDTVQGGTKPATIETGAQINVPMFVNEGDMIKVDTRTGTYLERVK
ncbi:translation elongation factor P (EF-P) [Abditibacterium utsteinense]|uniref:Elongation factor P n=1 Tax=Abditibacterium utsteinense TaxID=1960156 RepID=A0A2S8SSE9_9BACT|nr:translation elongation factor P (EF-P) [Abditibacterium utsteinense]